MIWCTDTLYSYSSIGYSTRAKAISFLSCSTHLRFTGCSITSCYLASQNISRHESISLLNESHVLCRVIWYPYLDFCLCKNSRDLHACWVSYRAGLFHRRSHTSWTTIPKRCYLVFWWCCSADLWSFRRIIHVEMDVLSSFTGKIRSACGRLSVSWII